MIYYIDNEISELRKSDLEKNGITHLLPSEINYIPDESCLIVNCEMNIDKDGNHVERSSFYGIKLVQDLRKQDFKGKILFCSFLKIEHLLKQNESSHAILQFTAHGFVQFPTNAEILKKQFEDIDELDEISLIDCKDHFCNLEGYINEELHTLKNLINKDNFKEYALNVILNVERDLITNLDSLKKIVNDGETSNTDVFNSITGNLQALSENSKEGNNKNNLKPKWRWEILWLDDEIEEDNLLKTKLEKLGVKVHLKRTYSEAENIWNQDYYLNNITLVIVDYRLKIQGKVKGKQGYLFIKEVGQSGKGLGLVAYSALDRQFMLKTLKHYGFFVDPHSKFDYKIDNDEHTSLLTDKFSYLGDLHWEQINNQPISKQWPDRQQYYFKFRNDISFFQHENEVSYLALENLNDFISFYNKIGTKNENGEEIFKKEDLFLNYTLPIPLDLPLSNKIGDKQNSAEGIKNFLFVRRVIIGIYAFIKSQKNINSKFSRDEAFDIVRVVARRSTKEKHKISTASTIKEVISIAKAKTTNHAFGAMGLALETTWPYGLFPEEKSWLISNGLLKGKIEENILENYNFILRINKEVKKLFDLESYSGLLKKSDNDYFKFLEIEEEKNEDDGNFRIYFTKDNYPCIKNIFEVKMLLKFLSASLGAKNLAYNSEDFGGFIRLWRFIIEETTVKKKDFDLENLFKNREKLSLNYFLRKLKTTKSDSIIKEVCNYWKSFTIQKVVKPENFTIEDEFIFSFEPMQLLYKKEFRWFGGFEDKYLAIKNDLTNYVTREFNSFTPKENEKFLIELKENIKKHYKFFKLDNLLEVFHEIKIANSHSLNIYELILKFYINPIKEENKYRYTENTQLVDETKNIGEENFDIENDSSENNDSVELNADLNDTSNDTDYDEINIPEKFNRFNISVDLFSSPKEEEIFKSKIDSTIRDNDSIIKIEKIDDGLIKRIDDLLEFLIPNDFLEGFFVLIDDIIPKENFTFRCNFQIHYPESLSGKTFLFLHKDFF